MKHFKIISLSKDFANKIREERRDHFGHEVVETIATGYGPCRVSLKPFRPGVDKRLLLSHSPFEIDNAFNQPGPIFISANEAEPYSDVHNFPPEIKNDKKNFPLSLIGYNQKQQMVFTQLVGDNDVEELIENIFLKRHHVAYLHVRNSEACCFICKIERV